MFSYKPYRQSHKTHILYSVTFFLNRAICMIMWKNFVDLDSHRWQYGALHAGYLRLQTHSQFVVLTAFPLQQWLHEGASMFRDTYCACFALSMCGSVMWKVLILQHVPFNILHKSIEEGMLRGYVERVFWEGILRGYVKSVCWEGMLRGYVERVYWVCWEGILRGYVERVR
jgi:hypothetical protein